MLLVCVVLFSMSMLLFSGDKRIEDESKLKKYRKHATWKKVKCKKCHGTGNKIVTKIKNGKTVKVIKVCPYCKGKGYTGKSKK